MPINVNMPNFGDEGACKVVEILVQPGQVVVADQPLLTVEANKTSSDVGAPVKGVVGTIRVSVGDVVHAGTCVMTINT
ncbi:hypothetical protein HED22_00245 [Thalassospira sp. HF15]|uniref:biotin/lipoyl-containing protein n=1 Tax=Thalassospira sp. HF15 TaxID=2722755 RepID=UPI001431158F|nr:biotin/lipoyl-containing protein [Thalassospira sp. HF15]NIY74066.1 hypothetical protein [Thalassospira sp. HF15]